MSEALDAINAEIVKRITPNSATLQLSKRCFDLALAETLAPIDVNDPLYGERWLYGQWVAAFQIMPAMEQAASEVHVKLMLHLCGISSIMKQTNVPFWHLFQQMSTTMLEGMEEIFSLNEQRAAIIEKEGHDEPLH